MTTSKRPALRKNDRVTLSRIKRVIPAYGGKPFVGREDVLTVSHLTGTGSKRSPWHVVVTDGTHFWHLEPDDVSPVEAGAGTMHSTMKSSSSHRDLNTWLDQHGYHHAHAKKTAPHPYTVSSRMSHARIIHQEPTDRPVFAAHERDHHITTSGRRALSRAQFALPPGPEEMRRGIKGRLPIDTIKRARNALQRASQMQKRRHITAGELAEAQRAVHRAWPSIHSEAHATMKQCYVITIPPTAEMGSYKTRHCGPKADARRGALWDYNVARHHDGLPPVKRLPRSVKLTKDH